MEENSQLSLGKYLQKILEEKNITINELHEKTRISKKYLKIILNDDYENYPPNVYLKGYLKEISKILEIDFSILESQFLKKTSNKESLIKPKYEPILAIEKESKNFWIFSAIIIFIIFAGIIIFFFTKNNEKNKNNERYITQKKIKKQTKNNLVLNKKNFKKPQDKKLINSKQKNFKLLQIIAEDLTWVRVTMDNISKKTYFLQKGDNVSLKAKNFFKLDIGNAGGIKLIFNNKDIGYPGKKGEVKHIILK